LWLLSELNVPIVSRGVLPVFRVAGSPIPGQRAASLFDCVAQTARRAAPDGVAIFVENDEFIVTAEKGLATFVVEDDHVIGFFSVHRYHTPCASFIEGLDNFGGLWTRSASSADQTTARRTPRLAVRNKNSWFILRLSDGGQSCEQRETEESKNFHIFPFPKVEVVE
jgi:hypothetical protein